MTKQTTPEIDPKAHEAAITTMNMAEQATQDAITDLLTAIYASPAYADLVEAAHEQRRARLALNAIEGIPPEATDLDEDTNDAELLGGIIEDLTTRLTDGMGESICRSVGR